MTICFAVNHAVCTAPLIVASTLLGENAAYVGLGILYVAAVVGSLLVAAPACAALGLRHALVAGGTLFCVYIGGFALALCASTGSWLQWTLWVFCSACGGMGGAVMWTAQGGYFAETGTKLATITGETAEVVKASLAGSFSFWFLIFEVMSKLGFSALQSLDLAPSVVSFVFLTLGVASVMLLFGVRDLRPSNPSVSTVERVLGVVSLWPDPVIWLLSPVNLTFGFSAAFMNGYVNGVFLKAELGENSVAAVGAITPLVAAGGAKLFGYIGGITGKGPVIMVGAVCFFGIPFCLLALGCCNGWGSLIIFLYIFQGLGRAVYESTNRAVFADFYTGDDTPNAFANCALQSNSAFAICFFLQTSLGKNSLAALIMVLAVASPFFYGFAQVRASTRLRTNSAHKPPV